MDCLLGAGRLGLPHWSELESIDPADLPEGLDDPETVHEVISEICNINSRIGDLVLLITSLAGRMPENKHTQPIVEDMDVLMQVTSVANSELASKLDAVIETRCPAEVFACLEFSRGAVRHFEDEYHDVSRRGEKWAEPLPSPEPEPDADSQDEKPLQQLLRTDRDTNDSDIDEENLFNARRSAKRSGARTTGREKRRK
jgi:hypothetical protein